MPFSRGAFFWQNHLGFIAFLIAHLLFRLGYITLLGLDLVGDETYYWDWSRQLDYGYYSKPPMVAWLVAFSTHLCGHTELAIRGVSAVLGTLSLALIYTAANLVYSRRAGWIAACLFLASPGNVTLNLIFNVDPPLILFWSLSLVAFLKARQSNAMAWWVMLGIASGLALLSKQMGLFIPVIVTVACISDRERPSPWRGWTLSMFLFAALGSVIIIWNAQHNWIMFQHTAHHFEGDPWSLSRGLYHLATHLVSQAVIVSPVTFFLQLLLAIGGPIHWKNWALRERTLWLFGPLASPVFILLAIKQHLHPNWPAVFYVSGFVLLAGWLSENPAILQMIPRPDAWRKWTLRVGFALAALTCALPWLTSVLGGQGTSLDAAVRLRQWRELALGVQACRQRLEDWQSRAVIGVARRQMISQMAFYLPDQPRIFCFDQQSGIHSQYELWPAPVNHLGQPVFILSEQDSLPQELLDSLEACHRLERVIVTVGPDRRRELHLFAADQLLAWPSRRDR